MNSQKFLNVCDLSVFYGPIHAIKNVSFSIKKGDIATLIGSNGAGKSTILRTISGLLPPTSGRILFDGIDITNHAADEIVSIGISQAPEGRGIFHNLSVEENLDLGAYSRRKRDRKFNREKLKKEKDKVFELFPRIRERLWQNAGTLSGGEQQMLAIGRALMSDPTLLLLDEPSLGLAPLIIDRIFEIIREINNRGTTVLLVEQNARMAMELAHYTLVLETGKIVLEGESKTLISSPEIRRAYLGEEG